MTEQVSVVVKVIVVTEQVFSQFIVVTVQALGYSTSRL